MNLATSALEQQLPSNEHLMEATEETWQPTTMHSIFPKIIVHTIAAWASSYSRVDSVATSCSISHDFIVTVVTLWATRGLGSCSFVRVNPLCTLLVGLIEHDIVRSKRVKTMNLVVAWVDTMGTKVQGNTNPEQDAGPRAKPYLSPGGTWGSKPWATQVLAST